MSSIQRNALPLNPAFGAERRTERDLAEMLGLVKGVLIDGVITDEEAQSITAWMKVHADVCQTWPGDVLSKRLETIFADGCITADERKDLADLLTQIVGGNAGIIVGENASTTLPIDKPAPKVIYKGKTFVLTGTFAFAPRGECERIIKEAGGNCWPKVTLETDYLVIGTFASKDWVQTSHGRKIEKAIDYRKKGAKISIIGEDHWAASLPH